MMLFIEFNTNLLFVSHFGHQVLPKCLNLPFHLCLLPLPTYQFLFHCRIRLLKVLIPSFKTFHFFKIFESFYPCILKLLIPLFYICHLKLNAWCKIHKRHISFSCAFLYNSIGFNTCAEYFCLRLNFFH